MTTSSSTAAPGNASLVFDKYEVIRRLAIGGMGEVFLARQVGIPGFERYAILKNLLPELAQQQDFVDQFLDEARVIGKLNHPNIVSVYEVGMWREVYFISMEYIHGIDISGLMRAAVKRRVRIPVSVAARIIRDAAIGLDHAHKARDEANRALGIVHRDISPQNIMVRQDGVTKVVDFGIAKASNKASRTQTGALKGKLQYMAPEQLNGEKLDGRADQFALGVVFWEMCAGKRLFKGHNELETFELILQRPYPALSSVVDVPAPINDIVMRMLSKDRKDRFPDCAAVAEELGVYLSSLSREVGETLVASVVKELVGAELEQRLSSTGNGPVVGLGGVISGPQVGVTPARGSEPTQKYQSLTPSQTLQRPPIPPGPRSVVWLGLAAGVAVLALGGGVVWFTRPVTTADETARSPVLAAPVTSLEEAADGTRVLTVTEPVGAAVSLDGKVLGLTVPCSVPGLVVGRHALEVTRDGATAKADIVVPESTRPPVVTIESVPANAAVWLGREAMGTTPVNLTKLRPDVDYLLTIELRGYEPQEVRIRGGAGEKVQRSVKLLKTVEHKGPSKPPPATKPPPGKMEDTNAMGMLSLRTTPWVKLFIDDKPMGQTPVYRLQVPAGRHTLRMVNEAAGVNETRTINVPGNGQFSETWKLKP